MPQAGDEFEFFFEKEWSDGLPVVIPTEARVAEMLSGTRRDPDEVIGAIPPGNEVAAVYTVAVHAVMAGCKPAYLPVVIGGLEAILAEPFSINGIQATMSSAAPLLIVNGPYAKEIGLHGGSGCFGPGFRANATIGRAIRLMLLNLGAGIPGVVSMSTFGHPGRYTYCIAENEAQSPWEPLSATKGFGAEENVLTAVAAIAPFQFFDDVSNGPERLLAGIADSMSSLGSMNSLQESDMVVAMAPDHANICAKAGMTKAEVHQRLCEMAGRAAGELKKAGGYSPDRVRSLPCAADFDDDEKFIPVIKKPEHLLLIVAGGIPGPQTNILHGWNGASRSVTRKFEV
ncbi:MAG: hypothetical protein O2807_00125 [bacterium]|nr:hypothetical protein [bacterium]